MYNPYDYLPQVPVFTVISTDIKENEKMSLDQVSGILSAGGKDVSPQLSWRGFPGGTKSFVITVYDPDAPTANGFWHWGVVNIPVSVTTLASGAGDDTGSKLPKGAFQLKNDASLARYVGAAPPKGHGKHHYYVVVHAIDVPQLDIPKEATPAYLGFILYNHTLGRATIVTEYER